MRKYIRAHWRGEHSLARSYWVNGVLLGIPLEVVANILEFVGPANIGGASYLTIYAVQFISTLIWLVWFAIGTLRSAANHIRTTGRKFWARVAQFICWLNLILLPFITYLGLAVLWNLIQMVFDADNFVSARLSVVDGDTIYVEGNIVFDTPEKFSKLIEASDGIELVHLESLGGYVDAADLLARQIVSNELDTYTYSECASACTQIFMAGERRIVDPDAILAFHLGYLNGLPSEVVKSLPDETDWVFREKGVPEEFLETARSFTGDEMWEPTLNVLVANKIVSHVYDYNEGITYLAGEFCSKFDCSEYPRDLVSDLETHVDDDG